MSLCLLCVLLLQFLHRTLSHLTVDAYAAVAATRILLIATIITSSVNLVSHFTVVAAEHGVTLENTGGNVADETADVKSVNSAPSYANSATAQTMAHGYHQCLENQSTNQGGQGQGEQDRNQNQERPFEGQNFGHQFLNNPEIVAAQPHFLLDGQPNAYNLTMLRVYQLAQRRIQMSLPLVVERKTEEEEKVEEQFDVDDQHYYQKVDSTLEEEVKKEEKVENDSKNEDEDDDLGSEFYAWLQEQFSLHFTTELIWPMPSIEDDEEEFKEASKAQQQTAATTASAYHELLIEVDPLYETNGQPQPQTSTPNSLSSNQSSPGLSLHSSKFNSSYRNNPEFCQLFEKPLSPTFHMDDEEDEAVEDDGQINASFTTAPETAYEDFEEFETAEAHPSNTLSSGFAAPSSFRDRERRNSSFSSSSESLAPMHDNASQSDTDRVSSEVNSEDVEEDNEKMSESDEESRNEEGNETEATTTSFSSHQQPKTSSDELFASFDLSFTSARTSSQCSSALPPDPVWEDDREDVQTLAALEQISAGHNPAAIDQAVLDPATACIFCPSVEHCSAACSTYATTIDRIYRAAKEQHRCLVCLLIDPGHLKADCPRREEIVCPQCGLAHYEMLYHETQPEEEEVEAKRKAEEEKKKGEDQCPY